METEDGVLYYGSQRKVVKKLSELFPNIGITIFTQALIIESISKIKKAQ